MVPRQTRAPHRILVVDDDEACCYALGKVIRNAGYKVAEACGFTPALAALESMENAIDLLLTDIKMPVHGFALARMAQRVRQDIKVIYVTGYPELAEMETLLPGSKLLTKPISPADLVAAVDDCFAGDL